MSLLSVTIVGLFAGESRMILGWAFQFTDWAKVCGNVCKTFDISHEPRTHCTQCHIYLIRYPPQTTAIHNRV